MDTDMRTNRGVLINTPLGWGHVSNEREFKNTVISLPGGEHIYRTVG
jgi:hypothetical protein